MRSLEGIDTTVQTINALVNSPKSPGTNVTHFVKLFLVARNVALSQSQFLERKETSLLKDNKPTLLTHLEWLCEVLVKERGGCEGSAIGSCWGGTNRPALTLELCWSEGIHVGASRGPASQFRTRAGHLTPTHSTANSDYKNTCDKDRMTYLSSDLVGRCIDFPGVFTRTPELLAILSGVRG